MIHGIFYKTPQKQDYRHIVENHHADLVLSPAHQNITSETFANAWLAQAIEKKNTAQDGSCLASIGSPRRAVIAAWARLDNRQELAQLLDISNPELKSLSDPELILRAYLKWGDECTARLLGDFSFAIYDILENRLFCARDHMGIKPFYYYDSDDIFIFSSSMRLFHRIPNLCLKPRMEWAARFLLSHSLAMDFETTAYESVFKLPPAHDYTVTTDKLIKKRYFAFHTDKIRLKTSEEYVDYYREQLNAAVKHRVQINTPLGSELSGGLDSATVTAYAIKHYSGPLIDFHAFGFAHFKEEPQHILRVSQHLGIPMTHICCNQSLFEVNTPAFKVLGAPVQQSNAILYEIFYDMAAKHGVRTLLSGFGGDEFVSSIYGHLYLHELLNDRKYIQLYQNLPGNALKRAFRFSKFIWNNRNQPGVQGKGVTGAYHKQWMQHVIKDEWVHAYTLKDAYDAQDLFNHKYQNLDQFTLENRLAPFISTRTEECTLMAGTYGVEYRWPLLDVRLIQAFLSVPSSEKYHRGVGRFLHKRAIGEVVPENIIAQRSKYMGERIVKSIPKKTTLNHDLHPGLLRLMNQPKLFEQEKRLCELSARSTPKWHDIELVILLQNIRRINALDLWLKHYFARDCDWA
jgi:asparagine synthase (glutamine-hydrolysing)